MVKMISFKSPKTGQPRVVVCVQDEPRHKDGLYLPSPKSLRWLSKIWPFSKFCLDLADYTEAESKPRDICVSQKALR